MSEGGRWRRYLRVGVRVAAALAIVGAGLVGWNAYKVWSAWRSIERIDFDLGAGRDLFPPADESAGAGTGDAPDPGAGDVESGADVSSRPPVFLDEDVDVYVLVGSDQDKVGVDVGDADAILLFLRPHGGERPLLMSLPRDLALVNPCTRAPTRLVAMLEGCGDQVNGPELLALVVGDFIGLEVDHFAVLSFGAFDQVVGRLGGVRICVDNDLRLDEEVTLPAGCAVADGQAALAWLRSRVAEEYVDGEWRAVAGGDLARSERQQALLLELLGLLKRFRSPIEVAGLVGDLSDVVALDETLSFGDAIDIAWEFRNVSPSDIARPELAAREQVLRGEFVRVPTQPFSELLESIYRDPPA